MSDDERRAVAEETLDTHLATYRYTIGDPDPRLGFIIEDRPSQSYAVQPGKGRVDLYGYASGTLAAVQVQHDEIRDLQQQVRALREEIARCRK